jgi:hypothetical protein
MPDIVCDLDLQPDPYPVEYPASCPVANLRCAFMLALALAYERARC